MIEDLVRNGVGTVQTPQFSKAAVDRQFGGPAQTDYPRGNDKPTVKPNNAEISGDTDNKERAEETEILSNLDQKVKELVTAAGGTYRPPNNPVRVTPELLLAMARLERARPLLQKALERSQRREHGNAVVEEFIKTGRVSGSPSGSASGSASGSISGGVSGHASDCSCAACVSSRKAHAGSASGSASGSVSGEESGGASGSPSGEISKADIIAAQSGDQMAALRVMGRR